MKNYRKFFNLKYMKKKIQTWFHEWNITHSPKWMVTWIVYLHSIKLFSVLWVKLSRSLVIYVTHSLIDTFVLYTFLWTSAGLLHTYFCMLYNLYIVNIQKQTRTEMYRKTDVVTPHFQFTFEICIVRWCYFFK